MSYRVIHGDCIEVMRNAKAESVHAVVCDPPYGLEFMGKTWDSPTKMLGQSTGVSGGFNRIEPGVHRPDLSKCDGDLFAQWCEAWATEALRILKPGGHLVAFGGTRMWHHLATGIERAGFEIRESIAWMYGSGFPKSHNVGKNIDKLLGNDRPVIGEQVDGMGNWNDYRHGEGKYELPKKAPITGPGSVEAAQWHGWGTAIKPAFEPIVVARKPLSIPGKKPGTTKKANVAQNVLEHGCGAYNIDGCRIPMQEGEGNPTAARYASTQQQGNNGWEHRGTRGANFDERAAEAAASGRWPANVMLDGYAADELDAQAAGVSRFFYIAKASKADHSAGLGGDVNTHPTRKPTMLMRELVRLVTPPGGQVLDPFMGSGSTGVAAMLEGFKFIGIEMDPAYVEIARARIEHAIAIEDANQEVGVA